MKKKIINGFLAVAMLFGATSAFVSCKDYEEENLIPILQKTTDLETALNAQNNALQQQIDALKQAQTACRNRCDSIVRVISAYDWDKYLTKEEADATYLKLGGYEGTAKDLDEAIKALEKRLNTTGGKTYEEWVAQIDENNRAIGVAKGIAENALALAREDSTRIEGLTTLLTTTVNRLDSIELAWSEKWQEAYDNAAYAKTTAEHNARLIDSLATIVDSLCGLDHDAKYDDTELQKRIDTLFTQLSGYATKEELKDSVKAMKEYADELFKQVNLKADSALALAISDSIRIDGLENTIGGLEKKYEKLDSIVAELVCDVNELKNKVSDLNRRLTRLEEDWKNLITDIKIENTTSAYGYFATPVGLNMNLLTAFYGRGTYGVEFPTKQSKFYIDAAQNFTDEEIAIIGEDAFAQVTKGAGEYFVAEVDGSEVGNAGDIYFTVNPHNVDATGLPVDLVNTKEELSPITIGAVQRADTVLTHGYFLTRADNAFYVGKATLKAADVEAAKLSADIDLEKLKDAAKTVLNDRSKSSVLKAAVAFYDEVSGINTLPKYGLRTQWTDQSQEQLHKLYSNYEAAATAIHPLSFNTLKDYSIDEFPGIETLEDVAAKLAQKVLQAVVSRIPDITVNDIEFVDIELITDDRARITYNYSKTVSGETIEIDIDKDLAGALNDIIKGINENIGASSSLATEVANLLNEVKKINQLKEDLGNANVKNYVVRFMEALNTRLVWAVNNANRALQPVLLATQNGKMGRVSTTLAAPTVASGAVTLIPTTYNLELLAPAYKKFVAVANVYDASTKAVASDAAAKAATANGGENMKTVIDGNKNVTLKGEAGYIYEVIYSAVDYSGVVANRRCYVQF